MLELTEVEGIARVELARREQLSDRVASNLPASLLGFAEKTMVIRAKMRRRHSLTVCSKVARAQRHVYCLPCLDERKSSRHE